MGRDKHQVAQVRKAWVAQISGAAGGKLRDEFVQHFHVVRRAEPADYHQGVDLRLFQQVGQFVGAVGRVDGNQGRADFGSGVLRQQPLHVVGGPDADVLALLDAQGHQPSRCPIHLRPELPVGVADAGGDVNHGLAVGEALRLQVKNVADGAADFDALSHKRTSSGC